MTPEDELTISKIVRIANNLLVSNDITLQEAHSLISAVTYVNSIPEIFSSYAGTYGTVGIQKLLTPVNQNVA